MVFGPPPTGRTGADPGGNTAPARAAQLPISRGDPAPGIRFSG